MNLPIEIGIEVFFLLILTITTGAQRIGIPSKSFARMTETESERDRQLESAAQEARQFLAHHPNFAFIDSKTKLIFLSCVGVVALLSPRTSTFTPALALFYLTLVVQSVVVVASCIVGIGKYRYVSKARRVNGEPRWPGSKW